MTSSATQGRRAKCSDSSSLVKTKSKTSSSGWELPGFAKALRTMPSMERPSSRWEKLSEGRNSRRSSRMSARVSSFRSPSLQALLSSLRTELGSMSLASRTLLCMKKEDDDEKQRKTDPADAHEEVNAESRN